MTMTMTMRMRMTTKMTDYSTWPATPDSDPHNRPNAMLRRAVHIHGLRDPLGRKGFRQPRRRIEGEGKARRLVAVTAITSFVASLGLIIWNAPQTLTSDQYIPNPNRSALEAGAPASASGAQSQRSDLGANPSSRVQIQPTAASVPRVSHTKTRSSD